MSADDRLVNKSLLYTYKRYSRVFRHSASIICGGEQADAMPEEHYEIYIGSQFRIYCVLSSL